MGDTELSKIPKFLRRLHRETTDKSNSCINWSSDGERLRITDKDRFIKETLPRLSRTKEYSSFIRQLNIYGFVKVKSDDQDVEEYCNVYFKKDYPKLMENITRVKKFERIDPKMNYRSLESNISYLQGSNIRLTNELSQLRERVEKQERTIGGLLEILGKVFRTGVQNINFDAPQAAKVSKDLHVNLIENQKKRLDGLIDEKRTEEKNSFITDMDDIFF